MDSKPQCNHISIGREKWTWLPVVNHAGADVRPHPWCVHCGVVKNISEDRAYKLGYWMNILSRIADRFSLKQVQKRCIANELTRYEGFNDNYFVCGSIQKQIFLNIIKKYSKINIKAVESFIY